MRAPLLLLAAVPSLLALSCSSKSSTTPDTGDAGDEGGTTTLTYTPAGCAYSVTPPDTRAFTDLALDQAVAPSDPAGAAPARVRIGLGGGTKAGEAGYADPTTTAVFTWETALAFHGSKVKLGATPTAMADLHAGYSWTTPGVPTANMHEAHVCGLTAGTTYYYQVGGGAAGSEVWSATQSFTTVPATGSLTLGVSGDSRDSSTTFQLVNQRMRDAGVALQIFTGDLVLFGTQESMYSTWLDAIWKDPNDATKFLTLGQQMILTLGGNHENQSAQYYGNFALPGDGPYAESYASMDIGNAHFVLLDDQAIAGVASADEVATHLAWLEADLTKAEANRAARPFIVVAHHRGEFSTSEHSGDKDVATARTALVPIWDKHHVDLVLNGHDHNYERSKPITGPADAPVVQTSTTAGTSYIVCAGAGATPYTPGASPAAYRAINQAFGGTTPYVGVYSLLTMNANTLTVKAYGLKAAGGSVAGDDLIDTLALTR